MVKSLLRTFVQPRKVRGHPRICTSRGDSQGAIPKGYPQPGAILRGYAPLNVGALQSAWASSVPRNGPRRPGRRG